MKATDPTRFIPPAGRPGSGEESRPTPEADPEPSAAEEAEEAEEAEALGHWLGRYGIDAVPPAGSGPAEREAFRRGHQAGLREFEGGELERWVAQQERQAMASVDPRAEWNDDEVIRAVGVAESRTPTTP